ncbi:MAG: EamA family transporter [Paludibacteraceae bacterium]|jgi:drug/metabolite transporter (DMT)-like permease|nr:EamA family transporter [Paludibacteraceae bacterium]MED9995645.1 EamA family transporter [Paludibacteraceae bacterium]
MKVQLLLLSLVQSLLLVSGQVLLKIAINRMEAFSFTWGFFKSVLLNLPFAGCGLCYGAASLLWFYIVKHFDFHLAYPMISLSYVFGTLAAIVIFHEQVPLSTWIGVGFIVLGCMLVAH